MTPNTIAMPLMVIRSLCNLEVIHADYDSADSCFGEAISMIFVHSIGINILYWAILHPFLEDVSKSENFTHIYFSSARIVTNKECLNEFIKRANSVIANAVTIPNMIGTSF